MGEHPIVIPGMFPEILLEVDPGMILAGDGMEGLQDGDPWVGAWDIPGSGGRKEGRGEGKKKEGREKKGEGGISMGRA